MTYDEIFRLCNLLALLTWVLLIVAPRWKWTGRIVVGFSVTLLAALYVYFAFQTFDANSLGDFGSLKGVMSLFTQEGAVLVGWIHYLAFDLMTGYFILRNAAKHAIPHLLLVPCLLLTFMLGPTGLLLYLLIRLVKTKHYFAE